MQLAQSAATHNAGQACYLCLNPKEGVDTGVSIVGEGVLYICKGCIADLARTVGYELEDRTNEIETMRVELNEAVKAAEDAEWVLTTVSSYADATRKKRAARSESVQVGDSLRTALA